MADIKISQLGAALVVNDSDVFPATASGVTEKISASLLKEYMIGNTSLAGIGDASVTGAIKALADEKKVLYWTGLTCSAMTGNFCTKNDGEITADHVVAMVRFANPSAITTDVTATTVSGTLTLNGTCTSATTAEVLLIKKDN